MRLNPGRIEPPRILHSVQGCTLRGIRSSCRGGKQNQPEIGGDQIAHISAAVQLQMCDDGTLARITSSIKTAYPCQFLNF